MKQKKLILVKLIGIGNDESKRINNDDKDENDSIEKEGYKYNEDKCNNKDNDDDNYYENIKSNDDGDSGNNDDDWEIECVGVIVRLVSITPVMLNLIDYPRLKLIELMKVIKVIKVIEKIKVKMKMIKMMDKKLNILVF